MSRRRVLVVGAGPYQCDVIRAASRAGHVVIAIDGAANAPGLALAALGRVLDIRDTREVVRFARAERVDTVLSAASDAALPAVAAVAEALGLPGLRTDVLARGRDKLATYHALTRHGLPAPFTCIAPRSIADAIALQRNDQLGPLPWVVKPRSSAGGRGVTIVREFSALEAAIARAEGSASDASGALLQAHVPGVSVGIEACFFGGVLVRAFTLADQYCEGFVSPVGHALPSELATADLALVHHTVSAWGAALGVESGVVNFDARLDGHVLRMIEANLRPGGSSISELLRVSLGVDVSVMALRCALGEHPRDALTPFAVPRPAASRLVLRAGGAEVLGLAELPRCADAELVLAERVPVGATPPVVNGVGLYGRCIVRADSAERAVLAAEQLAHTLAQGIRVQGDA